MDNDFMLISVRAKNIGEGISSKNGQNRGRDASCQGKEQNRCRILQN